MSVEGWELGVGSRELGVSLAYLVAFVSLDALLNVVDFALI